MNLQQLLQSAVTDPKKLTELFTSLAKLQETIGKEGCLDLSPFKSVYPELIDYPKVIGELLELAVEQCSDQDSDSVDLLSSSNPNKQSQENALIKAALLNKNNLCQRLLQAGHSLSRNAENNPHLQNHTPTQRAELLARIKPSPNLVISKSVPLPGCNLGYNGEHVMTVHTLLATGATLGGEMHHYPHKWAYLLTHNKPKNYFPNDDVDASLISFLQLDFNQPYQGDADDLRTYPRTRSQQQYYVEKMPEAISKKDFFPKTYAQALAYYDWDKANPLLRKLIRDPGINFGLGCDSTTLLHACFKLFNPVGTQAATDISFIHYLLTDRKNDVNVSEGGSKKLSAFDLCFMNLELFIERDYGSSAWRANTFNIIILLLDAGYVLKEYQKKSVHYLYNFLIEHPAMQKECADILKSGIEANFKFKLRYAEIIEILTRHASDEELIQLIRNVTFQEDLEDIVALGQCAKTDDLKDLQKIIQKSTKWYWFESTYPMDIEKQLVPLCTNNIALLLKFVEKILNNEMENLLQKRWNEFLKCLLPKLVVHPQREKHVGVIARIHGVVHGVALPVSSSVKKSAFTEPTISSLIAKKEPEHSAYVPAESATSSAAKIAPPVEEPKETVPVAAVATPRGFTALDVATLARTSPILNSTSTATTQSNVVNSVVEANAFPEVPLDDLPDELPDAGKGPVLEMG